MTTHLGALEGRTPATRNSSRSMRTGACLVWTGGTDMPSTSAPLRRSARCHPEVPCPDGAGRPVTPSAPDAERRQLTVMFCDLVDSTTLSSQLDPEDVPGSCPCLSTACAEVITQFDGHIAQLLGDGLWCTLAIPRPMKMTPNEQSVLGWVSSMLWETSIRGLQQAKGIQLRCPSGHPYWAGRCGGMGGAGRQEQLALGEVPNLLPASKDWLSPIQWR